MTASAEHPAPGIRPNETVVPLLSCLEEDATVEFFTALGFEKTWDQRRPYLYLAFRFSGFELHYGHGAPDLDPATERAVALAALIELSVALDEQAAARQRGEELRGLPLDDAARAAARAAVAEPGLVEPYLKAVQAPEGDIRT